MPLDVPVDDHYPMMPLEGLGLSIFHHHNFVRANHHALLFTQKLLQLPVLCSVFCWQAPNFLVLTCVCPRLWDITADLTFVHVNFLADLLNILRGGLTACVSTPIQFKCPFLPWPRLDDCTLRLPRQSARMWPTSPQAKLLSLLCDILGTCAPVLHICSTWWHCWVLSGLCDHWIPLDLCHPYLAHTSSWAWWTSP